MIKKAILGCLLVAAAAFSTAQSDPTKPIGTVNGETISGMEYFRRMEFLPGVGRLIGDRFVSTYPGYLALQQIINERLLLQLAKERNVMPRPADVQKQVEEQLKQRPDMLKNLERVGLSRADLERQLLIDMAEFNLVTMGVNIADVEVEKYYKENQPRFTLPRRYKLRVIAVPTETKEVVDKDLASGKAFAEVAKSRSQASSAAGGGSMGDYLSEDAFADPTKIALQAAKVGKATDWVQGESGNWFKFFVEDVKPREVIPLDAKLKDDIRRTLMIDRGRVRNNIDKLMMEMRRKAKVTINQPGISDMIDEWLKTSTID